MHRQVGRWVHVLSSQVVSLPLQSVIQEVANFCAAMDTLIDQDGGSAMGNYVTFLKTALSGLLEAQQYHKFLETITMLCFKYHNNVVLCAVPMCGAHSHISLQKLHLCELRFLKFKFLHLLTAMLTRIAPLQIFHS